MSARYFKDKETGDWLVWLDNKDSEYSAGEQYHVVVDLKNGDQKEEDVKIRWAGTTKSGDYGAIGELLNRSKNTAQKTDNNPSQLEQRVQILEDEVAQLRERLETFLKETAQDSNTESHIWNDNDDDDDLPF